MFACAARIGSRGASFISRIRRVLDRVALSLVEPEHGEAFLHMLWKRRSYIDDSAARMGQRQAARQEMKLGFEPRRNGAQRIVTGRIIGWAPVVLRIADDRMADLFAMGAQLMGAAGDRAHRQPRQTRRYLVDNRIEGERMLGVGIAVLRDPHALEVRPALPTRFPHALALGEKH